MRRMQEIEQMLSQISSGRNGNFHIVGYILLYVGIAMYGFSIVFNCFWMFLELKLVFNF